MLKGIKNNIKGFFNSSKQKISGFLNPLNATTRMLSNVMMTSLGMKKKSKIQVFFEKIIGFIKAINKRLFAITDKTLEIYNSWFAGKGKLTWSLLKMLCSVILIFIKKLWKKLVDFYQTNKKRAIIYVIVLYSFFKIICFAYDKITGLFVVRKNEMIVLARKVKSERVEKNVNCYGYVESENNLTYQSEVRGNVDKIVVQEKQYVKQGQLLMVLDSKFTANSYISAKSILESKKLQYNAIKQLYEEGLESKGNLKAMEADLESASSNFESAKKAYNGLFIYAPFDGYIDNIKNKEGAQVNVGTTLFTIERMDSMQVKCDVQNLLTNEVSVGDNVDIYVSGYKVGNGKISVVGDSVDVLTGSRTLLINQIKAVDEVGEEFRPGISVMIKVKSRSQKDVYKISSEALETTPTGAFMVKVLDPKQKNSISSKNVWIYDENDGIDYVIGLNNEDIVIERGHEFVLVGEKNINYQLINGEKGKVGILNGVKQFIKDIPEFALFVKDFAMQKIEEVYDFLVVIKNKLFL